MTRFPSLSPRPDAAVPATARGPLVAFIGLAGLAYAAWCAIRHLTNAEAATLFGLLDFGIHEFGHLFFSFFGEWVGVAGGSLMQLLIPLGAAVLFVRQGERQGVAVCGAWLAVALARLAVYMADARELELDLVSFSPEGGIHDWNYLLNSVGLIAWDTQLAGATRLLAWLLVVASVTYGLLAWQAASRRPEVPGSS